MAILQGFDGTLQVDGYAGYEALTRTTRTGGNPLLLAYCWANARRKLHGVHKSDASPVAGEGLRRIAELYAIEAEIRGKSPEERLAVRQQRSAPVVAAPRRHPDRRRARHMWVIARLTGCLPAFWECLTQKCTQISPKSRLGEKLGYIHRHWLGLVRDLDDGRLEMDTNPVENRIRS